MINALPCLASSERPTILAILVALCLGAQSIWTLPAVAGEPTTESAPAAIRGGAASPETERIGLWERPRLFDNLEVRTRLEEAGFKFGAQEQSEAIANTRGGLHRGAIYEGALQVSLVVDTQKAFGLPGGTFYVSAYQIRGRNPSSDLVPVLQTLTGVEASRSTRLFDLYYEQSTLDGQVSLRFGQLAADDEFIITQYGTLFVNSSFGFPGLPGVDLPSGGPIYPLAAPGVRLRVRPFPEVTLLGAAFNGDPAGPGIGDPQRRDGSGTAFRLRDGVFAISRWMSAGTPASEYHRSTFSASGLGVWVLLHGHVSDRVARWARTTVLVTPMSPRLVLARTLRG